MSDNELFFLGKSSAVRGLTFAFSREDTESKTKFDMDYILWLLLIYVVGTYNTFTIALG